MKMQIVYWKGSQIIKQYLQKNQYYNILLYAHLKSKLSLTKLCCLSN